MIDSLCFMFYTGVIHVDSIHEGVFYHCDQCKQKVTRVSTLKRHVESNQEGVFYHCDQCKQKVTKVSKLKRHVESNHEGVFNHCDQCKTESNKSFYTKETCRVKSWRSLLSLWPMTKVNDYYLLCELKRHVESIHEGVFYHCDQCKQKVTIVSTLKRHV